MVERTLRELGHNYAAGRGEAGHQAMAIMKLARVPCVCSGEVVLAKVGGFLSITMTVSWHFYI